MNEHEKLETALDLLEAYAHGNGICRAEYNPARITVWDRRDCAAIELLAEQGRFRIIERVRGGITGYWRDEDPERKAGK